MNVETIRTRNDIPFEQSMDEARTHAGILFKRKVLKVAPRMMPTPMHGVREFWVYLGDLL